MATGILYIAFAGPLTQPAIRAIVEPALRAAGLNPGAAAYATVSAAAAPAFTFDPSRAQKAQLAAQYGPNWPSRDDIAIPTVRSGTGSFVTSGPFVGDQVDSYGVWASSADGNTYVAEPMPSDARGGPVTISAYKQAFSGNVTDAAIDSVIRAIDRGMGGLETPNGGYYRLSIAPLGRRLRGDHGIPPTPGGSGSGWLWGLAVVAGLAWNARASR